MADSFPYNEYRSYEEQKALLDNTRYSVYVFPDPKTDCFKSFITLWQFKDFAFIEHFAVDPAYRNQGLGSLVLREILNMLPCQICLEVELPETDFAKRRISFYERNGFFTNQYPYIQPPYSKDKNPIPLLVMTSGGNISNDRFIKMKETIFTEVYNTEKAAK